MSEAAESAHVRIVMADYVNADPSGKINLVGAGITFIGFDTSNGRTPECGVVATVSFGAEFQGESPAVELWLEDQDGALVALPAPEGTLPQFLRVGAAQPLRPNIPQGMIIPDGQVRPRVQFALQFGAGLPLAAGHGYRWRLQIDGTRRDEWTEPFFVVLPSAGPIVG